MGWVDPGGLKSPPLVVREPEFVPARFGLCRKAQVGGRETHRLQAEKLALTPVRRRQIKI